MVVESPSTIVRGFESEGERLLAETDTGLNRARLNRSHGRAVMVMEEVSRMYPAAMRE